MSDKKDQPDADKPDELGEQNDAAEPGEPEQGEDDETSDEQSGHVVTLDEIRKDAERSIETFERLNTTAQPWAQGMASHQDYFENLSKAISPLAGKQFNYVTGLNNLSEILKSPALKGIAGISGPSGFASIVAGQLNFAEQFLANFPSESMLKTLGRGLPRLLLTWGLRPL